MRSGNQVHSEGSTQARRAHAHLERWALIAAALLFAACAHAPPPRANQPPPPPPARVVHRPAPKTVGPRPSAPKPTAPKPFAEGLASFYGPGFWGHLTANGERLHRRDLTAASRTLPFGTCLVVENVGNGRRVRVRVNDRGPYVEGRILDVSEAAGRALGMLDKGLARVRLFHCSR